MPSNPDETSVAIPQENIDKLIGTNELSYTFHDNLSGKTASIGQIPYQSLVRAIYSYDGGATWHDMGVYNSWSGFDIDPPVAGRVYTSTDGVVHFSFSQSALVNGGADYTMTVKFAMAAAYDLVDFDTAYAYFSGLNAYDSTNQYLDIAAESSFTVTSAATHTTVIPHNLGYVPFVDVWQSQSGSVNDLGAMMSNFGNSGSPGDGVIVDETNLTIYSGNHGVGADIRIYYKIYKED